MADTKMIKEVKHSSLIELLSNQTNNKFYYLTLHFFNWFMSNQKTQIYARRL